MKIFLSHASEDKPQVRKIRSFLPRHVQVWLDEDELDLGVKFPKVIEKAIHEESDFVIVFLGHHAMKSDWVERELNWALQREEALGRTFVLPVLLDDIRDTIRDDPITQRLYLMAFDHSDTGLEQTAQAISKNLFAQISRHFSNLTPAAPAEFFNDLTRDLTAYKEIAYKLHATLGDSVQVLATNPHAFNQIVKTVDEYNDYSADFIQRLPQHCSKVRQFWGRNLGADCAELITFIEEEVYRGQVFALNEVRESLNLYSGGTTMDDEKRQQLDATKNQLLDEVDLKLKEMTRLSTRFLERVEREL
jgi:hypothetical protein